MDNAKPQPRKADQFAGKGSLADTLRKKRIAIESGDPTGGQQPDMADIPEEDRPHGSGKFTMAEIKRGYRCLK